MIRADAKAYSTLPGRTASGAWSPSTHKARFILMLTNGVDPYNGSTSIMNQGSAYVDNAIADAQRRGHRLLHLLRRRGHGRRIGEQQWPGLPQPDRAGHRKPRSEFNSLRVFSCVAGVRRGEYTCAVPG